MKQFLIYFIPSLVITGLFASGLAYVCLRINRRGWAADPLIRDRQILVVFVVLSLVLVIAEIHRILNSARARSTSDAFEDANPSSRAGESDQASL